MFTCKEEGYDRSGTEPRLIRGVALRDKYYGGRFHPFSEVGRIVSCFVWFIALKQGDWLPLVGLWM